MTQELEKELQQEYDRFIEFGNLLDKRMRTYIVQYLQNKFDPDRHIIPTLNDQYFEYFQKALDQIFLIEGLMEVTKYNQHLKKQVIFDILYWLRKAYKKSRIKNPYEDEQLRLEGWAVTPLSTFVKRWGALPDYLSSVYKRTELDHSFFKEKFKQLLFSPAIADYTAQDKERIEVLFHDLLAQWDALLYAKILDFQLSKFEEEQESYVDFMNKKVTEYNKIRAFINPFTDYLGWDMSRQLWQETSFELLHHYLVFAEIFKRKKKIDFLWQIRIKV